MNELKEKIEELKTTLLHEHDMLTDSERELFNQIEHILIQNDLI